MKRSMNSGFLMRLNAMVCLFPAFLPAAFNYNWDPTLSPFEFEFKLDNFRLDLEFAQESADSAAFQDSIDLYLAKTDSIRELTIPLKFSELGFYSDMATQAVTPEAHSFQVNSALWSDGSHKDRWIVLPPGGGKVAFKPDVDLFDYPDKTILVKLFRLRKSAADTTTFPWETRLLVNHEEERNGRVEDIWYFFTYKWNKDGSDADLVSLKGFDTTYFANDIPNATDYVKWKFPDQSTCAECHRKDVNPSSTPGVNDLGRAVLGFFPAQLSRTTATGNQITDLFARGVFSGAPPTAEQLSRRWIGMDESIPDSVGNDRSARDSVLNNMSRAYIAANCSGCHGTRGLTTPAPFGARVKYDFQDLKYFPMGRLSPPRQLKWYEDTTKMRFQDSSLSHEYGILGSALIRPGLPQQSILFQRQLMRNSDLNRYQDPDSAINYGPARTEITQMPPYATYKVNERAIAIMEEWIRYMPDSAGLVDPDRPLGIQAPRKADAAVKAPILMNRMVVVPEGWRGSVELISVKGRRTELSRILGNTYAIPDGIPGGIYMIRVGERAFTRFVN